MNRHEGLRTRTYGPAGLLCPLCCAMLATGTGMGARAAAAQEPSVSARAHAALDACVRLAESPTPPEGAAGRTARAAADTAEALHRRWTEAAPGDVEAWVGLGQTLSRCQTPFAGITRIMGLVDRSNEALERALSIDPAHWLARYVLAMNHYRPPAFVGRTDDAIREFEILLAQQASRTDSPQMASTFAYLGDLYLRQGRREDAVATWERGAALFPDDPLLRERLATQPGSSPGDETQAGPPVVPEATPGMTRDGFPQVIALEPLVVEARDNQLDDAKSGTALRRLDVLNTPGGAADLMQSLQTLPGITRASESADLYVRGGEHGETAIYLDGGKLLSAGRWETFNGSVMGVLDANVLRSAYFSAGGFSARYGNALSGVVDATSEDLPRTSDMRVGVSLVQAAATARVAASPTLGLWGSAAITDVGLLNRLSPADDFVESPRSTQGIFGVVLEPRRALRLKATAMVAADRATREVEVGGFRGPFASTGGTGHVSLSARMLDAGGRRGVTVAAIGAFRTAGMAYGVLDQERSDRALTLRADGDVVVGSRSRLRSGFEATTIRSQYTGRVPTTDRLAPGSPDAASSGAPESRRHVGAYVEVETSSRNGATVVAGLRADALPGERALTFDPRLAVAYRTGVWAFRVGGGAFHQGQWRPRYEIPDAGRPSGVARTAHHLVASAERDGEPSLRVEGYLKGYSHFADVGEGPPASAGRASGVDAIVRWSRQERLNGWLSYSLLSAGTRLSDGRSVPSPVDVTHSLTAVGRLALNDAWEVGGTTRLATGRPFTEITAQQRPDGLPGEPRYGPINAARLPTYARIDGRLTRYTTLGRGLLVTYLEVLNILDRANVMGYSYGDGYQVRVPLRSYFAVRTAVLGFEWRF